MDLTIMTRLETAGIDKSFGTHVPTIAIRDEDTSISELRALLAGPDGPLRDRALAKMLREARATWTSGGSSRRWRSPRRIQRRLGRRAAFWRFLIEGWRADGLL